MVMFLFFYRRYSHFEPVSTWMFLNEVLIKKVVANNKMKGRLNSIIGLYNIL